MAIADSDTNEATQKPETVAVASVVRSGRAVAQDAAPVPDDALRALLTEALTVLTIYAEVAVPVANYRGQPMSAHAPRELVERIHRAIGVGAASIGV